MSSGDVAWRLYDTYGFPIDLTSLMVEEQGKVIDMEAYERAKQHSIAVSQTSGNVVDDRLSLDVHAISELQSQGFKPTNDLPKYSYEADAQGKYGTILKDSLSLNCYSVTVNIIENLCATRTTPIIAAFFFW